MTGQWTGLIWSVAQPVTSYDLTSCGRGCVGHGLWPIVLNSPDMLWFLLWPISMPSFVRVGPVAWSGMACGLILAVIGQFLL